MLGNWIRTTSTTTGAGDLTLSSVSGYPTFADVFALGVRFRYAILADSDGSPVEEGIGYLSASTTLVRERPVTTFVSSTYDNTAPSAVSLAAGTYRVVCAGVAGALGTSMPAVQGGSGSKIVLPEGLQASASTFALTADTPRLSCLYWDCEREITQLAMEVTTAAGSGSDRIQVGIYSTKADGAPGDLICRTGDIAPNSTGYKTANLSSGANLLLPPGWYWWAIASNVGPTVRAYGAGSPGTGIRATPMGHAASSLNARLGGFPATALGGGWTALPATVTLGTGSSLLTTFPATVGAIVA